MKNPILYLVIVIVRLKEARHIIIINNNKIISYS